jgi:hypothetical protein
MRSAGAGNELVRWGLAAVAFLLASCGGSGTSPDTETEPGQQALTTAADDDFSAQWLDVTNPTGQSIRFNLKIGDTRFFASDEQVLDAITATPETLSDQDVGLAIHRFLVENRRHADPYTDSIWAHSPTLMMNSIGAGLCDDTASVFAVLGQLAGRPTRVLGLSGHVVSEMRVDGRWTIFDPDLEAYYLDENFELAGYADLSTRPWLITEPIFPQAPHWATELLVAGADPSGASMTRDAYSQLVADIYSTTHDNATSPSMVALPELADDGPPLFLPPGAMLSFGRVGDRPVQGMYGARIPVSFMQLRVENGWSGHIRMPFVLRNIFGTGIVVIDGVEYEAGSDSLKERLVNHRQYVAGVDVTVALGGRVVFDYLLNERRYPINGDEVVVAEGDGVENLIIAMRPRATR